MNLKKVIIILGLAGFTVMADNWVVSPLLPAIGKDIGVSSTAAGLLITSYMLPFGIFQLIFGPLADRFGKKQILTIAMFFFTFATALTALGPGIRRFSPISRFNRNFRCLSHAHLTCFNWRSLSNRKTASSYWQFYGDFFPWTRN